MVISEILLEAVRSDAKREGLTILFEGEFKQKGQPLDAFPFVIGQTSKELVALEVYLLQGKIFDSMGVSTISEGTINEREIKFVKTYEGGAIPIGYSGLAISPDQYEGSWQFGSKQVVNPAVAREDSFSIRKVI